jgi:hypothetical protein
MVLPSIDQEQNEGLVAGCVPDMSPGLGSISRGVAVL